MKCVDEWKNFLERIGQPVDSGEEIFWSDELEEHLRLWASYRGQTLTRTGTIPVIMRCLFVQ